MSGTRGDDDLLPVSVRLGDVVPPDDPEDWTRPLTWIAAAGMLVAPVVALAWFGVAPPSVGERSAGTWILAATLVAGATATGVTQIGAARALAATVGSGLFGALGLVLVGLLMAGERQVGAASPTVAHAALAAAAGVAGVAAAATVAPWLARWGSRLRRWPPPAAIGMVVSAMVLRLIAG